MNFDEVEPYIEAGWCFEGKQSDMKDLHPIAAIDKKMVDIKSEYSYLSDTKLREFVLTAIKEDFRKNKGLNPDLPG